MTTTAEQPIAFHVPDTLDRLLDQIPPKDRERTRESMRRLHEVNSALWTAEDNVRAATDTDTVAYKRVIDQLNRKRNDLIDRIDEGFTHLSALHPSRPSTPVHTETLGSALDRLSVVTLREQRAVLLTQTTEHAAAADRLPAIQAQRLELARSISDLAAEVQAGARRLPDGRKFKLYGTIAETVGHVTVSPNIEQVIALGGLSECGKSSSGEYLRHEDGAYRLKMSFLIDVASKREGISDPYLLDRSEQARLLLEGLNVFADMHVDARRFTIESVHSDELIFSLKQMLGDRLEIVYLDAPAHLRAARSQTSRSALRRKDEVKTSRGAHRVAAGADHRIDNSRSVVSLHARLRSIANPSSTSALRIEPAVESFLPATIAAELDQLATTLGLAEGVDLVALTGSAIEGVWLPDWSDVDLMVSADHAVHALVDREARELQSRLIELGGIKCAVTLVTPGEIKALLVQPRVVYALARLGDGRSSALYSAPGLRLPIVTGAKLRHAATHDLPLVVVTLRRLIVSAASGTYDVQPIYKHIVLALRLMLRLSGVDAQGSDTVVDKAEESLAELGSLNLPAAAALARARGTDGAAEHSAAVLAAAHRLLEWYAEQVEITADQIEAAPVGAPR